MLGYWKVCVGLLTLARLTWTQEAECEGLVVEDSGSESVYRWTYEKSTNVCKAVLTKSSASGPNVFREEKDCQKTCIKDYYNQHFPPGDAVCELDKDPGRCMALLLMYYYDKERQLCDSFFYGGCEGNGNRFESKNECNKMCVVPKKGKSGASDVSDETPESATDAGLIIGIIFGVVFGIAFLVTLAMYLVQRKKMKKHQHKRVPDTEMKEPQ